MKQSELAHRYSQALFDLAPSLEEAKKSLLNLEVVEKAISQPTVLNFLKSPQISQTQKEKIFERILPEEKDKQLLSFFLVLLSKGRINLISEIVIQYRELVLDEEGVEFAHLISAMPTDTDTKAKLKSQLEDKTQKKVEIVEKVDPKLIGGGILFIGHKMIDFSIRRKLNELKADLLR